MTITLADREIPASQNKKASGISTEYARALSCFVADRKPQHCIEVGMAVGTSTLAILEALPIGGTLTSIDPFQSTDWDNVGVLDVQRAGLAGLHTLIEEPSYQALPDLVRQGRTF